MVESIANAAISMSQVKTQQAVGVSVLKNAMDSQSTEMDALIRNMEASVTGLGQNLDAMA